MRWNVNAAAVAEQGCAERTAVVEDAPLAGGGIEEDVGVGPGNAGIRRVGGFGKREFVVAEHAAHCIEDLFLATEIDARAIERKFGSKTTRL